jgi:hypothetical protein
MEMSGPPETKVRPLCRLVSAASAGVICLTTGCSALLRSDDATFHSEGTDGATGRSISVSAEAGLPESGVPAIPECEHQAGARIAAKTPRIGALFGTSMAADGEILAAVAPFEANGSQAPSAHWRQPNCSNNLNALDALGRGAVRVFDSSTGFAEEALLPVSGLSAVEAQLHSMELPGLQRFGTFPTYSVGVSNEVIAVGLGGDGAKAPYQGSVRLFHKDRGTWVEAPAPIDAPTSRQNDLFGMAVAFSNRVLVVGAPSVDVSATDDGAAYVYDVTETEARLVTSLESTRGIPSAYFGYSVAIDGDWIAVGAPNESPDQPNAIPGAAYVFHRNGLSFGRDPQRLEMPDHRVIGAFGTSVALRGDILAVGAPLSQGCGAKPADGFFPGSAYIYKLTTAGEWSPWKCVESGVNYSTFGWTLGLREGVLLVGAPLETPAPGRDSTGAVYAFQVAGSLVREPCVIPSPAPTLCGSFGLSLAMTDSFFAVGSPYEGSDPESGARPLDSGGAYVFPSKGTY